MIEALSPQAIATRDKRCLRDFAYPEEMRDLVRSEYAYQMRDEEILALIAEKFPGVKLPSARTVQGWRLDAKREWDEQRLAVVSKTLWKSAHRVVPNSIAGLYEGMLNALDLMRTATAEKNDRVRLQAQRNVGDLGEKLLNQFRGGPAEGASPLELGSVREKAILKMLESGTFASREQAEATFSAWVEGTAAVVEEQALQGEGE